MVGVGNKNPTSSTSVRAVSQIPIAAWSGFPTLINLLGVCTRGYRTPTATDIEAPVGQQH